MDVNQLKEILPGLSPALTQEIADNGKVMEIPAGAEILREGQYVKVIPVVISGLIKVFSSHEDKELLLYYIKPKESCIMSFAASLKNEPSSVFAITEEDSTVLVLPVAEVAKWTKQFPDINQLFFQQYNMRYVELLTTINHLLFNKLDVRVLNFLRERAELTNTNPLKISHRQIASELGTAREVISRIIKKLETEGLVIQHSSSIEIVSV